MLCGFKKILIDLANNYLSSFLFIYKQIQEALNSSANNIEAKG